MEYSKEFGQKPSRLKKKTKIHSILFSSWCNSQGIAFIIILISSHSGCGNAFLQKISSFPTSRVFWVSTHSFQKFQFCFILSFNPGEEGLGIN